MAAVSASGTPTGDNVALVNGLARLGWSPDRLAREINRFCGPGTISNKAPYHWLRGVKPRVPMRSVIAMILSEHLGETIEVNDLWPRTQAPSGVHVVWSSADGPAPSWFGDAVLAAIDWLVTPTRRPAPRQDGPPVDAAMLAALQERLDQLRGLGEGGNDSSLLTEWASVI